MTRAEPLALLIEIVAQHIRDLCVQGFCFEPIDFDRIESAWRTDSMAGMESRVSKDILSKINEFDRGRERKGGRERNEK